MAKGPLITRTELRKRKEAADSEMKRNQEIAEEEYQEKEKEISDFYRKERKKNKEVLTTRSGEQGKIRERSSKLTKAIVIVGILLIIVILIVLNL
ncbi:hypothetical protein IW492_16985 [Enterococcus sp. BWB1-3]|uniref:cell wall synthase accessory phosphoprotein MacP n=1 Tax=unclassified Enterococcus TaxID=2608891 RepID=UPI0019207CCC|nr:MULTISPECIES: cell wall synthase accessory phosphoprotein MacP [unclassified Enterococcus]MBL1230924.1 hypothetical protein [Enterococcus sp. BWB1-3]MCB5952989.1 cell wall synthase accessory phosphoprotein MacP [Enterococcus sp. BWT-B8]MCB5956252.1 cell wall synthase accessory phosphoprotein MacP [Enterococcus sp. CWB-B31]